MQSTAESGRGRVARSANRAGSSANGPLASDRGLPATRGRTRRVDALGGLNRIETKSDCGGGGPVDKVPGGRSHPGTRGRLERPSTHHGQRPATGERRYSRAPERWLVIASERRSRPRSPRLRSIGSARSRRNPDRSKRPRPCPEPCGTRTRATRRGRTGRVEPCRAYSPARPERGIVRLDSVGNRQFPEAFVEIEAVRSVDRFEAPAEIGEANG